MATELINRYAEQIDSINLHGGTGGAFEVSVDGELVYSKRQLGRHAEPGEALRLVRAALGA